MLVYVTGLYAVRDQYLPQLFQQFQHLLSHLSAPLYVFTDREIPFALPENVHVIHWNLDAFDTYRKCMTVQGTRLPLERNPAKDTEAFMALMNTKVEMLWRSMPFIKEDATHVAWIDAGILKITKRSDISEILQQHTNITWPMKVTIPGCWATIGPPSSDRICWRFCGGFFVLPTSLLSSFYTAVTSMLESWLAAGHLVWEVNIWAALEWAEPAWFAWWAADHDDSMLTVPGWLSA
jgi:hypothetical protein